MRRLAPALIVLTLLAAGCGEGGSQSVTLTPSQTVRAAAKPSERIS